jgi:hypothetical protein
MSRTRRNDKGDGYEYWGRRPTKFRFADPGKDTKRNTHRMERTEGKKEVENGIDRLRRGADPDSEQD